MAPLFAFFSLLLHKIGCTLAIQDNRMFCKTTLFTYMYTTRKTAMLIVMLCTAAAAVAQTGWQWITCQPMPGVSQLWLRRTYTRLPAVQRATATLATNGYARLYVNGRLADATPLVPWRAVGDSSCKVLSYDVSAYVMRTDTLNLALWCASPGGVPCSVALRLDAVSCDGTSGFTASTDTTWLCRPACVQTGGSGTECTDGRQWHSTWSYGDTDWVRWTPAREAQPSSSSGHSSLSSPHSQVLSAPLAVAAISRPVAAHVEGNTVTYDFDHAFMGFVRLTLRDAKVGERIDVGGMGYVCSGDMDEQVQGRFVMLPWRKLTVSGDRRFSMAQIQDVEGIEVERGTWWPSWPLY